MNRECNLLGFDAKQSLWMIDDDGDDCCGRMLLVAAVVDICFLAFLSYLNKFPSDCWLY